MNTSRFLSEWMSINPYIPIPPLPHGNPTSSQIQKHTIPHPPLKLPCNSGKSIRCRCKFRILNF